VEKIFAAPVEFIQASAVGPDPQDAGTVFEDRADLVITQARRIRRIVLMTNKTPALPVKLIQVAQRADPENACSIFVNDIHLIVTQTFRVVRIIAEVCILVTGII
jgi:hypothetical protein